MEQDLRADEPKKLFETEFISNVPANPRYNVSAGGERFLVPEPVSGEQRRVIRIVQNWYDQFRDRQQD